MTTSVAVVGLGYGRFHVAEILALADRLVLCAVVDPIDPRTDSRLADSEVRDAILAVPWYPTLTELLAARSPDIVTIATPIHTHATLAREAMAAGANVLMEKPPTATLAEYDELVAATASSGRAVQVGFQARGGHALRATAELIAAGHIGQLERIGAVGLWSRDRAYYERSSWAGRRVLDGRVVMDGVIANPLAHAVDVGLVLAGATRVGDVRDVTVDAWHAHDIESDDTSSIRITTASGVHVAAGLTLCAQDPVDAPVVIAYGSEGEVRLWYTQDRLEVIRAGASVTTSHGRTSLLANLVDHIEDGAPLIVPLDEVGAFATVLEAIRTGPQPRPIAAPFITITGSGAAERRVVSDIDRWCADVARTSATFTELGAPWTSSQNQTGDDS